MFPDLQWFIDSVKAFRRSPGVLGGSFHWPGDFPPEETGSNGQKAAIIFTHFCFKSSFLCYRKHKNKQLEYNWSCSQEMLGNGCLFLSCVLSKTWMLFWYKRHSTSDNQTDCRTEWTGETFLSHKTTQIAKCDWINIGILSGWRL